MPTLETMLIWNTVWVSIWALVNLFFTILLFLGRGNGIYRAMRIYMALTTLFLFRNVILTGINIVNNSGPYYSLSLIHTFLAPAGAMSALYLAYQTWKAKR